MLWRCSGLKQVLWPEYYYRCCGCGGGGGDGLPDLAKGALERAIEMDPQHAGALAALGLMMHAREHDDVAAEACFKLALSLAPLNPDALTNYGVLLLDDTRKVRPHACAQIKLSSALCLDDMRISSRKGKTTSATGTTRHLI